MSSSDGTGSSPSQTLDFPQDSSASEDDTNEKLRTVINDLIDEYGRELFLEYNSNILPNLFNTILEEEKDQTFTFDVKEKVFPDGLKEQVESLIGEYGKESYAKIAKRACSDLPNLSFEMNDIVLDDCQKRKRKESPASHESISLLGKYDSPGDSEAPSLGSANRDVIPCLSPIIVFGNDEDESKRLKKKIKVAEGSASLDQSQEPSLPDGLTRTVKNVSVKRRLGYGSDDHDVEGRQEKEKGKEKKLEEDKVKKEENSGSGQENKTSEEEKKMEDDKKDQDKSIQ